MKCYPKFSPEDSDLGLLTWCTDSWGYARRTFRINGKVVCCYAHRLVAIRKFGPLTSVQLVDHRNPDKMDVRRESLRLTDSAGNSQSRRLGEFRGASPYKGKWRATVYYKRKQIYLGLFIDRNTAAQIAAKKRRELGFLECNPTKQTPTAS